MCTCVTQRFTSYNTKSTQYKRKKIDKWDFIKVLKLSFFKRLFKKWKDKP